MAIDYSYVKIEALDEMSEEREERIQILSSRFEEERKRIGRLAAEKAFCEAKDSFNPEDTSYLELCKKIEQAKEKHLEMQTDYKNEIKRLQEEQDIIRKLY